MDTYKINSKQKTLWVKFDSFLTILKTMKLFLQYTHFYNIAKLFSSFSVDL